MTTPLPQGELTVERMCALAGVSRAGYYRHWQASLPRQEETGVRDAIQRLALAHRRYGYRRIAAQLRREGLAVNRKRVLRLMREDNLLCLRRRPFVPVTTDSRHGWRVVPNLARGMVLTGLDQLWVADITYVRLLEEFAYLAIAARCLQPARGRLGVGDASAGQPCRGGTHHGARGAAAGAGSLIHHSDRGVQYACGDYTDLLEAHGIQPSMSRIGNPYDNAKAESFMKTLKQEEVDGRTYRDAREARQAIGSLHRGGLQSPATALGTGLSTAGRVRGQPPAAHSLSTGRASNGNCNESLVSCLTRRVHSKPGPLYFYCCLQWPRRAGRSLLPRGYETKGRGHRAAAEQGGNDRDDH